MAHEASDRESSRRAIPLRSLSGLEAHARISQVTAASTAPPASTASPRMRAGGRATEAGMDFQAEVGTWIAAHLLARVPIGGRFGLANSALPVSIRLETGEGLDDTLVMQDDGSRIELQSKTRANLSESTTSPLGKTIAQLARTVFQARQAGAPLDPEKTRAVLAVGAAAPRSLDALEQGCRAFDLGGDWSTTRAQRNVKEREALDLFALLARTAWAGLSSTPASEADLVDMARLFRIVRFSMDEGDDNWREASRVLGSRLYGSEANGEAPLRDLKGIIRGLIGSGAPADRDGLIRALRTRGHNDVGAPNFELDLARLAAATQAELGRLAGHTVLPIGGGVAIRRHSQAPLAHAVATGSLIVIGEPGAGKTGTLAALARDLRAAGDTVVFLSVDRFPGIAVAADLQSELGLSRPLVDVLAAAPGMSRKVLMIDALDAARGGPAEGVFGNLIEAMSATLTGQWTVVASCRTFDLKNGRRFREALPGSPPDATFAEPGLEAVRHFRVPRLSEADLSAAGASAPALGALLAAAPERLRDLLRNVFNLSLAAQLLEDGASPDSIRTVATQSDLIDAYEDRRLVGTQLQRAAAAAVEAMVDRRRLAVRKVVVTHDRLDEVIQTGVLTDAGDLVGFSHHVLFDHVAGRFFLSWDDPAALIRQVSGDSSLALMLAPSLRFALERLWRRDGHGKPAVWRLLADIYASTSVDPVLANVALRTAVECVLTTADIAGLPRLISERAGDAAISTMLSRLARFVGLSIDLAGAVTPDGALAWVTVAEAAAATDARPYSDPAQVILHTLFERADLDDPALLAVFGRAARRLLTLAWAGDPPMQHTAINAIRFVGRSFASAAADSRELLDRILRDPHFSAYADKEATWLAEQIMPIARSDPEFAVEIFHVLYSREISDDSTSRFGGDTSRIMPLSSNRRQDYRSARWNLGRKTRQLLDWSAEHGTRAVIEASLGSVARTGMGDDRIAVRLIDGRSFELVGHEHAFNAWDAPNDRRGASEDDVLGHYVDFLRACTIPAFEASVSAASSGYSAPAVWARVLGVGHERVSEVADLLWPIATRVALMAHGDTVRDAVRFVAAAYPSRSFADRAAFETEVLRPDLLVGEPEQRWWRRVLGRWLSLVDETTIATEAMRAMRAELAAADELSGNPPVRSMTMTWGSSRGMTRSSLANQGVDVEQGPDAHMLERSEALYDLVQQTPSTNDAAALAALWAATEATIALFDSTASQLNERVEQPVWGHVSNAVERIAGSAAYAPDIEGLPTVEELLAVLRRLWASRFPEPGETDSADLSYGNWAVRVYAADAYVGLADRFGIEHGEIIDMFDAILADPSPQVRLQAAQNLQVLSRIALPRMWPLAEQIAASESHDGVLGAFLGSVVPRFTWQEVERCEALIETVRARRLAEAQGEGTGRDHVSEALGALTAQLWIGQARPAALSWLTSWTADPPAHADLLTSFLSQVRQAFFDRYAPSDAANAAISDRAQQAAMLILEACLSTVAESYAVASTADVTAEARQRAVGAYRASEQLIGQIMRELYFGSGAHTDNSGTAPGFPNIDAMRQFLADYRPMLVLLANSREPETHHYLIQLYEYLIPGDPAGVFDALHALLLGPGAREGYHYEGLGSTVFVRVVTRYIADHRSIFEDDARRVRLVEVLRLFSDAGWSDALRLLYDLPELLR